MRYTLIDTLRGFSVLSMIFYHTVWDIVYIYGQDIDWFMKTPGYLWQQSICWSFILISGFCQEFAKKSVKDAVIVSLSGILVTLVSILFPSGVEIYYGILTFLGIAIFLTWILKSILEKIPYYLGLPVSFLLFLITKEINSGYLGLGDLVICNLPAWLYPARTGWISTLLGFTAHNFLSGDYFSVLPWYFLFLTGFFLARLFKAKDLFDRLMTPKVFLLNFLGKHALIIYLLHQPVIYFLLQIVFNN